MKYRLSIACAVVSLAAVSVRAEARQQDPTVASEQIAAVLRERIAEGGLLRLHALVVGSAEAGVALVGTTPSDSSLVRKGSTLMRASGGVNVGIRVKSVTSRGVELDTQAKDGSPLFIPGSFSPLPPPSEKSPEFLTYIETRKVPIGLVGRLIADQAGVNISVSDSASSKDVSVFLRNVTAAEAVEEICRATGLWFRKEPDGRIIRVMTMDEYRENLNTFREESVEMFTLLYPNVIEVASVIYGLHPDRTFLSLGEEELNEDDEYDISRRFRRFRLIEENGGSQFMDMDAPQVSGSGSSSGGGTFSFSRGGASAAHSGWDQIRLRQRGRNRGQVSPLAFEEARILEAAYQAGNTNLLELVKNQISPAAANIFVTLSRKNNMLVVRTSDVRVMDEIRSIVKKLDVPTPMVLLEMKILELSINDDYAAKFEYSFNRDTHSVGNSGSVAAELLSGARDSFSPTFAFKVVNDSIEADIKLLQEDGNVKVLATPTLLLANNEVSRIFCGKEYPLITGWTAGSSVMNDSQTQNVPTVPQIEKKDVGTMLLVTPNINADKTVTLRLLQENSEISAETAPVPVYDSYGNGVDKQIQYVESRSLAGTFVARDGMSVMAGGLVKEKDAVKYYRTPILGSIPGLGWFFRGTEKVKERTELVVLIKPHVILTPMEGGRISEELLKALSVHPSRDGSPDMGVHRPDAPHSVSDDVDNIVR